MSDRILLEPHAHTREVSPCGWLSGAELIRALADNGYGAVVITDHYLPGERETREAREAFLAGYRAAKAAGEEKGIIVLPGMEFRLKGHVEDYLLYGLEEGDFADLPDTFCSLSLGEVHELTQARGWLIYQAHPYRPKHLMAHLPFIDGIEIFNGNPRHNSQNRLASRFAMQHGLHSIAGSDVHRPGDVGIAGLLVPQEALTPKGLAAWLAATRTPRIHYQEAPVDGIRYTIGPIPSEGMMKDLYLDAGWTSYAERMKESMEGIRGSARVVTAWDDTQLIGMARAISDGHTITYVQDILVMGPHQRRGIGRQLLRRLLLPYKDVRQTVLITDDTPRTRAFYRACGFEDIDAYHCTGFIRLT